MQLDTGASETGMSTDFMAGLPQAGRPRCCDHDVLVSSGVDHVHTSRIASLDFAGALPGLRIPSLAVITGGKTHNKDLLVPGVVGFLGGDPLARFVVVLSPLAQQMLLFRYQQPTHLDATPFVDTGARLGRKPDGTWRVAEVYPGTPADLAGLQEKDHVLTVNGRAMDGMSLRDKIDYFNQWAPGDSLAYRIERGGSTLDMAATVVDLLPEMNP